MLLICHELRFDHFSWLCLTINRACISSEATVPLYHLITSWLIRNPMSICIQHRRSAVSTVCVRSRLISLVLARTRQLAKTGQLLDGYILELSRFCPANGNNKVGYTLTCLACLRHAPPHLSPCTRGSTGLKNTRSLIVKES
jgi:hypothetical protein